MPNQALAHFLTRTCYGSWLHGDARWSVHHSRAVPGEESICPRPAWQRQEAATLRAGSRALSEESRRIVETTIRSHCAIRTWELHALNVRTNHVHLVLTGDATPERAMSECKAWSTRRLREAGLVGSDERVWTRHGSTRYLWDRASLERAVEYVRNQ